MATKEELLADAKQAGELGDHDLELHILEKIDALPPEKMPLSDVASQAASNFIPSVGNAIANTANAVIHPVDTLQGALNLANGGLQKILPESVNKLMPESTKGNEEIANQFGMYQKERYGGIENIKRTIANDPAGVMMDISTLSGVGSALLPGKAGNVLKSISKYSNPISMTAEASGKILPLAGNITANVIGNIGTHTGGETLKQAAKSNYKGGASAKAFNDNLLGKSTQEQIIPELKTALSNMKKDASDNYNKNLKPIFEDKSIIDFAPIKQAASDALKINRYEGVSLSPGTDAIQTKLLNAIESWSKKPPDKFHTIEGLDALKKKIADIRDGTQQGTPERATANKVFKSVRESISNQNAAYSTVMSEYGKSAKITNEINKSLKLGENNTNDQALRALQSITRNNANTNYGSRLKLVEELQKNGDPDILAKLSGQALNSWQPRGLGGLIASGLGGAGVALGNPSVIMPMMLQSPKLMGISAALTGKAAGITRDINKSLPDNISSILYQLDKQKEITK